MNDFEKQRRPSLTVPSQNFITSTFLHFSFWEGLFESALTSPSLLCLKKTQSFLHPSLLQPFLLKEGAQLCFSTLSAYIPYETFNIRNPSCFPFFNRQTAYQRIRKHTLDHIRYIHQCRKKHPLKYRWKRLFYSNTYN